MLYGMTDDMRQEADVDPVRKQIGDNVRAEMTRRGRGQDWLGGVLRLSQPQISKRLNGRIGFEAKELVEVAGALDIPVDRLLLDVVAPDREPVAGVA